jgi:hypothetical protein
VKLHLPYFSEKTNVSVQSEVVEIKAFQIIVWLSISSKESLAWDPRMPKMPAVLDLGTTHNLALTEEHLMTWAGIHPAGLPQLGNVRLAGRKSPLREAGIWIHTDERPFRLKIDEGIAVLDGDWPRLPVLGLRALTNSKLQTFIYGDTK